MTAQVIYHNSLPIMQVDGVGVGYRKTIQLLSNPLHWALRQVSFDLQHGETLGVIGRNGSGKSTLMKLLAGIIVPDEGMIKTNARSVQL